MAKARITSNVGEGLYGIELEYDSADLDSQIEALRQQLIDIEQQVLDAQVAVIDAEAIRDALADTLDATINAYADGTDADAVVFELEQQLANAQIAVAEARGALADLNSQIAALESQIESKAQQLAAAEQAVLTAETAVANAEQDLATAEQNLTDAIEAYADDAGAYSDADILALEQDLADAQAALDAAQADLAAAQTALTEAQTARDTLVVELADLTSHIESLSDQIPYTEQQLTEAQVQVLQLEKIRDQLAADLAALESDSSATDDEIEIAELRLAEYEQHVLDATVMRDALVAALADLNSQIATLTSQVAALEQQVTDAEAAVVTAEQAVVTAEAVVVDATAARDAAAAALAAAIEAYANDAGADTDPTITSLRQQVTDAEASLATAEQQLLDAEAARDTIAAELAALNSQLSTLSSQVPLAERQIVRAEAIRDALAAALAEAINEAGSADRSMDPVVAATNALAESVSALNAARFRVQRLSGRKLSLAARKTHLENIIVGSQASESDLVWCADYTDDLASGSIVPVAVAPGEISAAPWVILPQQHPAGYGGAYNRALHGQLVPRMSMTPAATFYNWAMLPGWQRWMPTHRIGTITFVDQDTDTCNVTLDTARSSADPYPFTRGLNVNLAESTATVLEGVPIRYMTCNAAVFEAGDRVLVRFAQPSKATAGSGAWDGAEVVGFVSEPRQCDIFYPAFFSPTFIDAEIIWDNSTVHGEYTAEESAGSYAYSSELDVSHSVGIAATTVQEEPTETGTTRQDNLTFTSTVSIQGTSVDVVNFVSDMFTGVGSVEIGNIFSYSGVVRILISGTKDGASLFVDVFNVVCEYDNRKTPYPELEIGFAPKTVTRYRCVMTGGIEYVYQTDIYVTSIAQKGRVSYRDDGMGHPEVSGWGGSNNDRFIWPASTTATARINIPDLSEPAIFREGGTPGGSMDWTKIDADAFSFTAGYGKVSAKYFIFEVTPTELSDEQITALQQARNGELSVLSL